MSIHYRLEPEFKQANLLLTCNVVTGAARPCGYDADVVEWERESGRLRELIADEEGDGTWWRLHCPACGQPSLIRRWRIASSGDATTMPVA